MILLHTSDWHIGRLLYDKSRYAEYEKFLDWLVDTITTESVTAVIVAGDIFDTNTPSNYAQSLYYRFLATVAGVITCRHVVIVGGNHDSPTFLNAPQEILKALNVHVIGSTAENLADEVLVLKDNTGVPEAIVCAVPYLRDRDMRLAQAGESIETKELKLLLGIRDHYQAVVDLADTRRQQVMTEHDRWVPLIATGHLFTAGGKTTDGDGVRDLYVGSLAHVSGNIFPSCIDYVALGHLHTPQTVGGEDSRRFSGAPLVLGFGEWRQKKSVCMVDFPLKTARVNLLEVPVFQELRRVQGNLEQISKEIDALIAAHSTAWLEVIYDGKEVIGNFREFVEKAVLGSELEVLRSKMSRVVDRTHDHTAEDSLEDMTPADVFDLCLDSHGVTPDQKTELISAYREIIISMNDVDARAR